MIVYVDTSALVPLLIAEATSPACGEMWDAADKVVCTRLAYIEASAALSMALRLKRITTADAQRARAILDELWSSTEIVELSHDLMTEAATLALRHGLRGYDATHCAAAISVNDIELVAASGDRRLLAAWRAEGVAVRDISA